jgi:hypothetical protein
VTYFAAVQKILRALYYQNIEAVFGIFCFFRVFLTSGLGKDKSLEEAVSQLGGEVLDSSGYDGRSTHMLAAQVRSLHFMFGKYLPVGE